MRPHSTEMLGKITTIWTPDARVEEGEFGVFFKKIFVFISSPWWPCRFPGTNSFIHLLLHLSTAYYGSSSSMLETFMGDT
jgi:hypothetical protein